MRVIDLKILLFYMHVDILLSKELKNSIQIMVGQAVLELLIQNEHFDCFDL